MTLHLFLQATWFDMIVAGTKLEEYRANKPYWARRLFSKPYDTVTFHRGYSSNVATYRIKGISIGRGKVEWGASSSDLFIITFENQ